ncbi:MAG: hypothetical protein WC916_02980 [Candidatus Woesearchaeota archaeon]
MTTELFSNVGNLGDYKLIPPKVKYTGLITTPSLVMKLYQITPKADFQLDRIPATKSFLEEEIKKGEITPLTGIGFAIQSKDLLNVVRWDNEYPILMKNIIYGFEDLTNEELSQKGQKLFDTVKRLNIDDVGPFCIWEETIVAHERKAWKIYLNSQRSEGDKGTYFASTINGPL